VTVLFADVVRSMDIAAAVGAERLREIMSDLLDRSTAVVKRDGGTLSQFTGDDIMAMFGAAVALQDHAIRACLGALGIQEEAQRLAAGVQDRDGIDLRLRVGLNSGQVIAGEIGSGVFRLHRDRGAGRNGMASAESRGRGCLVHRDGDRRHRRRRRRRRGGRCAKRRGGNRTNDARAGLLVSDGDTNRSHGDYGAGTNDGRQQFDPLLMIRIHSDHSIRLWPVQQ
jgi:hypothetical protein